jgi:hypothetical protein
MKKIFLTIITILIFFTLSTACAAKNNSPADSANGEVSTTSQNGDVNLSERTKLILGSIGLEETDLKITAEQANALLPQWKVLRNLLSSDSASQVEIDALQEQIKESLSSEQSTWIDNLRYTPEEYQAAIQDFMPDGMNFGGNGDLSEEEIQARIATMQAANGGNLPEDFPGGAGGGAGGAGGQTFQGGGPGGDFVPGAGGGFPGGDFGSTGGTPSADSRAMQGRAGGSQFDILLINQLITILEAK